ncbi:serine hydrolase [Streptomyces sp. P1-3]|uniref:serine hydrolase n=1 Tax=Streptomyces sp. P1-3 TaxID=3421658 RepID=UPI003D365383
MTHVRIPGTSHTSRTARRARGALIVALAAGSLAPLLTVATAQPAAATTAPVSCTSAKAGLADKLAKDIDAALRGRSATTAVSLHDRTTQTVCTLRGDKKYDSASVVKVTVLATLLWDAKNQGRLLTERESQLATKMITASDNASTSALWKQLGMTKIKRFLATAGMTQTVPGKDGYWGLTQITARDEQKLMDLLTARNAVLSDKSRAYALKLMNKVISSQRWGTPAGAPSTAKIHVKNGWLSRATHGWRVHSVGAFTGGGHDYTITVLTHDSRTMNDGVATIQAVSRAIHKDLAPRASTVERYVPTGTPREVLPALPPS